MIITSSTKTDRFEDGHIDRLMECDQVSTFEEAGFFHLMGWKDKRLVVQCHARTEAEVRTAAFRKDCILVGSTLRKGTPEELEAAAERHGLGWGYGARGVWGGP